MKTLNNTILAVALATNVLSGISASYAQAMEAPTVPEQIMQVMEVSQNRAVSLPTPYATVNQPDATVGTQDIINNQGGIYVDSRLPESEWKANLAVVVANDHLGDLSINKMSRIEMARAIARMDGIVNITDSPEEAMTLGREIADNVTLQKMANREKKSSMYAAPIKGRRSNAFISTLYTSSTDTAKENLDVQRDLVGKNLDYINIDGADSDPAMDVVHHIETPYQAQIAPYWNAMWMVHEMGHSHHEQGNYAIDMMIEATQAPLGMAKHLEVKGLLETHSDLQQMVVTQSAMARDGLSANTLQALGDGMVRYRIDDSAEWMNDFTKDIDKELGMHRDGERLNFASHLPNKVELADRTMHQTEIPLMATTAIMVANVDNAGSWDNARQDEVVHALFEAYRSHPDVQAAFKDESILPFQAIPVEARVRIANEVAGSVAQELDLTAPVPARYPADYNPSAAHYLDSGFSPVRQQATILDGFNEGLMQLDPHGDYPAITSAIVRPANVHDNNDVLFTTLDIPPDFSLERQAMELRLGKTIEDAIIEQVEQAGGVTAVMVETPSVASEAEGRQPTVLAVKAQTAEGIPAALEQVQDLIGPGSPLTYQGKPAVSSTHFEPSLETAKLFEHTYAAAFAIDDTVPEQAQNEVEKLLYQTFTDSESVFGEALSHVASEVQAQALMDKLVRQQQDEPKRPDRPTTALRPGGP